MLLSLARRGTLRRPPRHLKLRRRRRRVLDAGEEQVGDEVDQLLDRPLAVFGDLAHGGLLVGEGDRPAGDVEDLAVDVPGVVGAEPDGHWGDLLGCALGNRLRGRRWAHAPRGTQLAGALRHLRHHARHGAGGDAVGRDAVAAEVACHHAGEAGDTGLGGAVVRLAGVAAQAGNRGEVHDPAVALLSHELGGGIDGVEVALEMDVDDRIPLLLAHVEDHAVAQDAGDVDEDVNAAEGVDALPDNVLAALSRGDAVVVGDRVAAGLLDLVRYLLRGAVVVPGAIDADPRVVDDHVGALLREKDGDGAADAAARAGDDGVAAFEIVSHVVTPSRARQTASLQSVSRPPDPPPGAAPDSFV